MEINLIRHGASIHKENKRINGQQYRSWVEAYDESGVEPMEQYPALTIEKVQKAHTLLTSDLLRATATLHHLAVNQSYAAHALFREAELPHIYLSKFIRLKPKHWTLFLRIAWFLGAKHRCESYREAKERAIAAADVLINEAREKGSICLVGHGIFNRLIARELEKRQWHGMIHHTHWSCSTYILPKGDTIEA